MKRSLIRRRRLIHRLALGLAIASIAAPSALAELPGPSYAEDARTGSSQAYGELYQQPNAGLGSSTTSAGETEAAGYARIYGAPDALPQHSVDGPRTGPATGLPQFSVDGPRTAPDAVLAPFEPVPVGSTGLDWGDTGIGIGIGMAVAAMLGAALLMGGRLRRDLRGV